MRDPAAEAEMLCPVEPQEARRVDIGQVGADDQRGHGKAGLALEAGLAEQRADEAMGQIVHLAPCPDRGIDKRHGPHVTRS